MEKGLQRLENHLPALFQGQLEWLPWLNMGWNILRTTPLFIFLLSYLPYRTWIFFCEKFKGRNHKPVVVILERGQKESEMTSEEARGFLNETNLTTFHFWEDWPQRLGNPPPFEDWIAIRYGGYYYVTTAASVAQMCLCQKAGGDLRNVIFVRNITAVSANIGIGERIAESQAYEMIFERTHHVETVGAYTPDIPWAFQSRFEQVIPSWITFTELRVKGWMGLAFVPPILQAKNYSRLAVLASLLIITLDVSKHWILMLYQWIFWKVSIFVKWRVFRQNKKCYSFFSALSERWNCSDSEEKKAYLLETVGQVKGEQGQIPYMRPLRSTKEMKVHFCKLKHLEDITFRAFLTNLPDAKNTSRCPRCGVQIYKGDCNWTCETHCAFQIDATQHAVPFYKESDGNCSVHSQRARRIYEDGEDNCSRRQQYALRIYDDGDANLRAVAAEMPRHYNYALATCHNGLFVE